MSRPASVLPPQPHSDGVGAHAADPAVIHALLHVAARCGVYAGGLTVCAAVFVCTLIWPSANPWAALVWVGITGLAAVVRIAASTRWRRSGRSQTATTVSPAWGRTDRHARWHLLHNGIALASGLAWSSLVFFATTEVDRPTFVVGFGLAIALMLASSFHAPHRVSYLLFTVPVVVAQVYLLQRLTIDYRGTLVLGWLGLVAVLDLIPRVPWASVHTGIRARIEHERRAIEQAALIDVAPLGIVVVREGRMAVCNDALLRMLGYSDQNELIGKPVAAIVADEDADDDASEAATGVATVGERGPLPPRIVRLRRADGSNVEVMRNVSAVRGRDGQSGYIGIYEDVQDRLAIEEDHRHAVQMTRLVFEAAGEGMAIVCDGVMERVNHAMCDLVGEAPAHLAGRPLHALFEDPQGWIDIESHFARLGNPLKLERRVLRSDGRVLWVNVTGCLLDAPGASATPRSIWILADRSVQKQKEVDNWHDANHDVMTGLPNRRFLQDRLDQALASARRDRRHVAVLELDLDGFKAVNDTHGHRCGDAVLEEVARRLSSAVRDLDTVGRWGGDEFVVVLREIDSRAIVEDMVARVIARLSEPIVHLEQTLSIGASIGIALFPDHGDDVEALMLAADLAMYECKGAGGNGWRFATPAMLPPGGKHHLAHDPMPAAGA